MGLLENAVSWLRDTFNRSRQRPIDNAVIEREFEVTPETSRVMQSNIELWYALYTNNPPWMAQDACVKPLGLAVAVSRELARFTLSEFTVTVSGGPRAEYIDSVMQMFASSLPKNLELGLALGGVAFRPYLDHVGRLLIDVTGPTAFTPTGFDGTGRAISGVFKQTIKYKKDTYTRLEYHGFETQDNGQTVYIIRNKAYKGDTGGGEEVQLNTVPAWAQLNPEVRIENIDRPLFAYFKNPSANDIEPESNVGESVYGGLPTISLLEQADKMWEQLYWEYKSGERKLIAEGKRMSSNQILDRLFLYGSFTSEGNLFTEFSPAFRNDSLYLGVQYVLKRIEYNVGLSFGTISDPDSVERTATEVLSSKNRQRITVHGFQMRLEPVLDDLAYAINAYCDLYGLAPAGEYEIAYNWGDGVLDDPETIRQDKAMDLQLVTQGIMQAYEFRMKYYGEDEATAKAMLTPMEDIVEEVSPEDGEIE